MEKWESDGRVGWGRCGRGGGIGGSIEDVEGIHIARMVRKDEEIQEDMGRRTVRRQTEAVVLDWNWECWNVCHSITLSSKDGM